MLKVRCEEYIEPSPDQKEKATIAPITLVRRLIADAEKPQQKSLMLQQVIPDRIKFLRRLAQRHFSTKIRSHSVIQEKQPFVIYAVEIFTVYSRQIEVRRFSEFLELQKKLLLFLSDSTCQIFYGVRNFLPKLTRRASLATISESFLKKRKEDLQNYCKEILAMARYLSNFNVTVAQHWRGIEIILEFFGIKERLATERHRAIQIQRATRRFLQYRREKEERRQYYAEKGYITDLMDLPDEIHLFTLSFLSLKDRARIARISKGFSQLTLHSSNLMSINLFPLRKCITSSALIQTFEHATLLQKLSLKFYAHLDLKEVIHTLAKNASPVHFKQLYLDGCENIDDSTLTPFVDQGYKGLSGLEILSLAECRKIGDDGLKRIAEGCPALEILIMLGCFGVSDSSVEITLELLTRLRQIDLGGTNITGNIIDYICGKIEKQELTQLKKVSMVGCKKVNSYHFPRLGKIGISAESGEDVFRFHLVPTDGSTLPRVTNSLLKTRSTLSMHRVYRYLLKKLSLQTPSDDSTSFIFADSILEISCFGTVLEPDQTLKKVFERHWFGPNFDQHLTLNYRMKQREKLLNALERNTHRKFPQQTGIWMPDHLVTHCSGCATKFSICTRRHHCRKCGLIFCAACSGQKAKLPQYGYVKPVRVCGKCFL